MSQTYMIILILCLYIACFLGLGFINHDKKSKKETHLFQQIKGALYFVMSVIALIYDLILNDQSTLTLLFTICIAIFESVQLFAQVYGQKKKEREITLLNQIHPMDDYKKIEILYRFCNEQLEFIRKNGEGKDARILAYEQVYDYFKYYACSQLFLRIFKDYVKGLVTIHAVEDALDQWKVDLEMSCIQIVKIPDIY